MNLVKYYLVTSSHERMALRTARDVEKGLPLTLDERKFLNDNYTPGNVHGDNPDYFHVSGEAIGSCLIEAGRIGGELPSRRIPWKRMGHTLYLLFFTPMQDFGKTFAHENDGHSN